MRIVIILCLRPTWRKVLAPEITDDTLVPSHTAAEQPSCDWSFHAHRRPYRRPYLLMTPRSLEDHYPQSNTPALNFACNSPTSLSNFEFTSLKFCGFLPVVNLSDHRITCEIGDERAEREIPELRQVPRQSRSPRSRSPDVRRQATPTHTGRYAHSIDELTRNGIKVPEILSSTCDRSRRRTLIVMARARLRRWCARSHFALQLLGF